LGVIEKLGTALLAWTSRAVGAEVRREMTAIHYPDVGPDARSLIGPNATESNARMAGDVDDLEAGQDPGWRQVPKQMALLFVPFADWRRARRMLKGEGDNLIAARAVYLAIILSMLLAGLVLLLITQPGSWFVPTPPLWPILVAVFAVVAGLRVLALGLSRPKLSSGYSLATTYRARMFIAFGYADMPAFVAFIGTIVTGVFWIYLLGLAVSLPAFIVIGPTHRNLRALQDRISEEGSSLSIVAVLRHPPARPDAAAS